MCSSKCNKTIVQGGGLLLRTCAACMLPTVILINTAYKLLQSTIRTVRFIGVGKEIPGGNLHALAYARRDFWLECLQCLTAHYSAVHIQGIHFVCAVCIHQALLSLCAPYVF